MNADKFRWNVRITSSKPKESVAFVRKHQFRVGPAISYDAEEGSITALEYALGGIGAELISGMFQLAKKKRLTIDAAEALVHAEIDDPMAQLGVVGATGHPGIDLIKIRIYVTSFDEPEAIEQLWTEVQSRSTLLHTFRRAAKVEINFQMT